jgi:hypothetical protein
VCTGRHGRTNLKGFSFSAGTAERFESKAASNSFPLLLANKDASLAQEEFVADVLR